MNPGPSTKQDAVVSNGGPAPCVRERFYMGGFIILIVAVLVGLVVLTSDSQSAWTIVALVGIVAAISMFIFVFLVNSSGVNGDTGLPADMKNPSTWLKTYLVAQVALYLLEKLLE